MTSFVHLHTHTEYSLSDGLLVIDPLIETAQKAGMTAIAITDRCNFFGVVQFYQAAIKAGIKPIIGADMLLLNTQQVHRPYAITLLCQNMRGYHHLTELISRAYLQGQQHGFPLIQYEWLTECHEGLIVLSGALAGDVGQALLANQPTEVAARIAFWQRYFPDRYYIELQRVGRKLESVYDVKARALALAHDLPIIASNDVEFLQAEDFEAHEARVCIYHNWQLSDAKRPRLFTPQQYLRTAEEMARLFADVPEALHNTVELAKRCTVELVLDKTFLPDFPVPAHLSIADYLIQTAQTHLEQRLQQIFPEPTESVEFSLKRRAYDERLATELQVINSMGFAGYFLIVADFIEWARRHHIPVGPGRGSGAGSLVAYVLGITNLDPLQHDLLFERFLNPERVSMPDFDIDFCMQGRDRVIEYVASKYGRDSVSQIITFGTMTAKAVVRDVGRVLGLPYGFVDAIAKLVPFELGMTLEKALQQENLLRERYETEEEVTTLIDLALKLEGVTRNAGKHAGGVVIAPTRLTDFTPLYCEHGTTQSVTQFSKDDIEAIGLVKFDFLGLRTLTIIHWALQIINAQRQQSGESRIDIDAIPMDDAKTFELLQACLTTAVFQLEGRGMKELIRRLKPDCFEHIVALVALFRPGPLQSGMVDDFIDRKHGRAIVRYPHPELEPILRNTLGVIVYQEQVMQIARVMAGYSLGKADLLRRAMGKKKPEEMAQQREIFVSGAMARGIDPATATFVFDLIEKFAGYGFNKSHSAAYALLSYQTAWLKAHFPAAFMAAVLSADMAHTDKIVVFIDDCRQLGLPIIPPHINHSAYEFTVNPQGEIIYGLGAIKGIGEPTIIALIEERQARGLFTGLLDFCARIDLRKINKRVLDALIKSGAMDDLGHDRATLWHNIDLAIQAAEQSQRNTATGQTDLFSKLAAEQPTAITLKPHQPWREDEALLAEKESLGLYLTSHPLLSYRDELRQFTQGPIANLMNPQKSAVIAGLIVAMRILQTKRGDRMAFISLDDSTARLELAVFSEELNRFRQLLVKDTIIVVAGEITRDDVNNALKMSCTELYDITTARERYAKKLELKFSSQDMPQQAIEQLKNTLIPFRGGRCPVSIIYETAQVSASFILGDAWRVKPTDECLRTLKTHFSSNNVLLCYE